LSQHQPHPSLVHGDLWSGNAAITVDGEPVILDPATYWGDREVDLAMTELFGGFPAAFYRGYNDVFPLDAGFSITLIYLVVVTLPRPIGCYRKFFKGFTCEYLPRINYVYSRNYCD